MGLILRVMIMDEFTAIHLFKLIKLGVIHPLEAPGVVKGIMIGFWRFEFQFIFGFWNKERKTQEGMYSA